MNKADFNGVWVFAEQREGQLQKVSLELLGEGRKIADKLGSKLTALLIGNKVQNLVIYNSDDEKVGFVYPSTAMLKDGRRIKERLLEVLKVEVKKTKADKEFLGKK